jgi:HEAT repeat protein
VILLILGLGWHFWQGADSDPVLRALIGQLKDENANVRWAAANSLAKLGPNAKAAVPVLMDRVSDDVWSMGGVQQDNSSGNTSKDAALNALMQIEPGKPEIIQEALKRAMKSSNSRVRAWATMQMGQLKQ